MALLIARSTWGTALMALSTRRRRGRWEHHACTTLGTAVPTSGAVSDGRTEDAERVRIGGALSLGSGQQSFGKAGP